MKDHKPFGWEVLDLRYGGLRARLETMHERVVAYLAGEEDSIPELEVVNEVIYEGQGMNLLLDWARVSRPQWI